MQKLLRVISVILITIMVTSPPAFSGGGFSNSGSSSGGVSDDAYGAGWNGETVVAPSQNALYDKIEAIVVGDPVFFDDSATAGNVTFVGCSDSISSAITAASAGDTLILGSCTYTVSSTITVNKALTIKGQGPFSTLITSGTTDIGTILSTTSDGLKLRDIGFRGSKVTDGILVDATAGTGFTTNSILFSNIDVNVSNSVDKVNAGIRLYDSDGDFRNVKIRINSQSFAASAQSRGIVIDTFSTMDADITVRMQDVDIYNDNNGGSGCDGTNIMRGIRFYNFNNGDNPHNMTLYASGLNIKIRDTCTTPVHIEAFHAQGARITTYLDLTFLDGDGHNTNATQNDRSDIRCDDGATCILDAVGMASGFIQNTAGTIYRRGLINAGGLRLDALPVQPGTTDGVVGTSLFNGTGTSGGVATGTGSRAGGVGAGFTVTLGGGGIATNATTTGTGGKGGSFTLTAGNGGSQITSSSVTNTSGAGGDFIFKAGDGGSSTNAGTTNNGANGGSFYLVPGDNGTGSTANGSDGNVYLGVNSSGTQFGSVLVGHLTRSSGTTFQVKGPSSSSGSDDFAGLFFEGDATVEATTLSATERSVAVQGVSGANFIARDVTNNTEAYMGANSTSTVFGSSTNTDVKLVAGQSTKMFIEQSTGNVGVGNVAPSVRLDVTGAIATSSTFTSSRTSDLGWAVVTGANTACTSTCTSAAVVGFDTVTGLVGPSDATADTCICAGAS